MLTSMLTNKIFYIHFNQFRIIKRIFTEYLFRMSALNTATRVATVACPLVMAIAMGKAQHFLFQYILTSSSYNTKVQDSAKALLNL